MDDNKDTIAALEAALRLAKAGQIRGAVMVFAYHDDRYAFRICDLVGHDVPPVTLLLQQVAGNLGSQWMDRNVEGRPELPSSLSPVEDPA